MAPSTLRTSSGRGRAAKRARTMVRSKRVIARVPRAPVSRGTGMPAQLRMKMSYTEVTTLGVAEAANATNYRQFSTNGIFDPNSSVGGHQPMYFDQMMALYRHYQVDRSSCRVTFVGESLTQSTVVGAYIEDDNTLTPGAAGTMAEQPGAKWTTLSPYQDKASISMNWDRQKAYGPFTINQQGDATGNPVDSSFYTFFASSTATWNVNIIVQIVYDVTFSELINLATS